MKVQIDKLLNEEADVRNVDSIEATFSNRTRVEVVEKKINYYFEQVKDN